jgi:hypothetical protein
MLALRYAALLALTVWVGGLIALGSIAAPASFDVLAARGVPDSRVVAGALFGEMLRRATTVGYICGAVLLVSLLARRILGPRPVGGGIRFILASVMLAATVYSGVIVSNRIQALQHAIGAAPSSLPVTDSRRAEFGRLHALSTALLAIPVLGGLILIGLELKD